MCGIVGLLTNEIELKRKIPALNTLLKHRGPDDEGYTYISSTSGQLQEFSGDDSVREIKSSYNHISEVNPENFNIILAHRRLSIIDLSPRGHGPMCDQSQKIWITYNGEIYNYIELREELIAKGYAFKTNSDTEVIINSYLCWGEDCLKKFNGMWAFGIWDQNKQQLFIARDRFGVKPLYYACEPEYFIFASEIKPITALDPALTDVDESKIPFFILYGNRLNTKSTYYKRIYSLEPSEYLIVKNNKIKRNKYYDIPVTPKDKSKKQTLENKLLDLLTDSIRLRFRSDVPVGTCLSGGFDSSAIVSLSRQFRKSELNTFSAVWKESECDESKYIDIVNNSYKCTANKIIPSDTEFEKTFDELCYYQEIPTEGPGLYPQWYVMKCAKPKVKVLLDGQGGDEVFGGYFQDATHLRGLIKDRNVSKLIRNFWLFLKYLNLQGLHSFSSWLYPRFYGKFVRGMLSEQYNIIHPGLKNNLKGESIYYDAEPPHKYKSYINNLSYHFIRNVTIPTLLHYEDRSSMAHSIESRVPFLDYRLVEFGINLYNEYLVNSKISRPLYRDALKEFLPDEIVNRKDKLGYPVPFAKWTRTTLKEYVCDSLLNLNNPVYNYLNKHHIETKLTRHFNSMIDFSWEIWRILSLEKFLSKKV